MLVVPGQPRGVDGFGSLRERRPRMNTDAHGLMHGDLTDRILKVFFEVYNEQGFGFLEGVYERCMVIALEEAGFRVERQKLIPVYFRGQLVGEFCADLVVDGLVILELKAAKALDGSHEAQLLNYLRATQIEVGLLLNFGPKPHIKRLIFDNPRKALRPNPC
jgi:GxxExxY protein